VNIFDDVAAAYIGGLGRENVTIVDYYGARAANKDLFHVMLHILGIHSHVTPPAQEKNPSTDLVNSQLLQILNDFRVGRGCPELTSLQVIAKLRAELSPPVTRFDGRLIKMYGDVVDARFRGKYGDRIIHGNRSTSLEAAAKVKYEEGDRSKLFRDAALMKKVWGKVECK
jgi:hypothetical protein